MPIPLLDAVVAKIVNPVITLIGALAVVYFLWGLFQMIVNAESEEARATGRRHAFYGLIGLFIIVAVFGIINAIQATVDSLAG